MSGLSVVLQLLQAAGTGLSAVQSMRGGSAAAGAGEDLARQHERQGEIEAAAIRLQAARQRGILRRSTAAAGFDPNRGTPAQVAAENAYFDELDAQFALLNARMRAKRSRNEASAARTQGFMSAASTLLQGSASALQGLGAKPAPLSKTPTGPVHGGSPPAPLHGPTTFGPAGSRQRTT